MISTRVVYTEVNDGNTLCEQDVFQTFFDLKGTAILHGHAHFFLRCDRDEVHETNCSLIFRSVRLLKRRNNSI